ncbi:INO80 complex subunit D [Arapaima gigas]
MYEGKHIHFSEVDNKPLCSYSPKLCKQRRLNGYAFCIRHVLEDRTAPFKQCEYVAKYNSQRCTNPIPKSEDRRWVGVAVILRVNLLCSLLDEMRARAHLESVALNIMVPPLALKTPNGLDKLPPSPTHPRVVPPPEAELLDPFAFHEDEMDGVEGTLQKASAVKKKLQNRLALNQRLRLGDTDLFKSQPEHFNPSTLPSQQSSSPLRSAIPTQQPGHVPQPPHPFLSTPGVPAIAQDLLCKPAPPQNNAPAPPGPPASVTSSPAQPCGPSLSRKVPPSAPPLCSSSQDSPQYRMLKMHPAAFSPPTTCRVRLRTLVQLCSQRHQQHGDLFPHLGLDWSEDSADEDEEVREGVPSYPYAWQMHERHLQESSDEDADCPRSARLLRLCTYLRQKYKHLCRQERAAVRQKKYRYAFRKALLHAASKDPDCAGRLMQELRTASTVSASTRPSVPKDAESGRCMVSTNGQACAGQALPYTHHCFQHVLLNRSQQLFSSCTAKFADGQQCSVPVFDITHQTPLCEEHAKKMDNFLRGDSNRRVQQQQQLQLQQQQRKPRRKTKPPALTKKHKKKRRRGPRRPQKPIPPAVPQGNLAMPSSLTLPTAAASIRLAMSSACGSLVLFHFLLLCLLDLIGLACPTLCLISGRSPSTPDLSTDELPDDITNDISDIPHDLELNQEDFSDVLPRLPDDLQDFDLFEGKNGDLLPTTEEAEELVRALQAMGSYPDSLVCLGPIGELPQPDGVDHRSMAVFCGAGAQSSTMGDLLNGRIPAENFSGLDLDDNLLHSTGGPFPPPPPAPSGTSLTSGTPSSSGSLLVQGTLTERTFRPHPSQLLAKAETAHSSPHSSHYGSEHVPSPYSDHISSPHPSSFQTEPQMLLEVPLSGVPCPPRSPWNSLPLSLTDPTQFGNLIGPEGHLLSTSLSTPPSTTHSVTVQPTVALSALPPSGLTGLTAPAPTSSTSSSAAASSSQHDPLTSTQPKLQLPQFSAAFGHQLSSHSGIPKDVQPSHSSTAPPTGFSIASATAASANNAAPPFTTQ